MVQDGLRRYLEVVSILPDKEFVLPSFLYGFKYV